jgi:predicted  nucleic acid-binding Zn-ribbon protein
MSNVDIRSLAFIQALERQRNDALNAHAQASAAMAIMQHQLQEVAKERDKLQAELDQMKASPQPAEPPKAEE